MPDEQRDGTPPEGFGRASRLLILSCSLGASLVCLLTLSGWAAGSMALAAFGAGLLPMAPSTAVVGLLLAMALAMGARAPAKGAAWAAGIAAAATAFLLVQWALKFSDLEGFLVAAVPFRPGVPQGRMSPVTALGVLVMSVALALRGTGPGRLQRARDLVALGGWASVILGFVVLGGYANLAPMFYQGGVVPVALPAALTLVLLGSGTAASAGGGACVNRLFSGPSVRARLLRSITPYLAAVVLLEGALDNVLERYGQLNPALTNFLLALVFCVLGAVIVLRASIHVDQAIEGARAALAESEEHHRAVTETAAEGIITMNEEGRLAACNPAALHMFGYGREEAQGLNISALMPERFREAHAAALRRLADGAEPRLLRRTLQLTGLRANGEEFPLELSVSLATTSRGRIFTGIVRDITERRTYEEALQARERELNEAHRVAGLGSWSWDLGSGKVTWSEELYRIAGLDPAGPAPTYREQAHLYTPASWARLGEVVRRALEGGIPYEIELEMGRPDGESRWILARGEAQRSASGQVALLRGTALDITPRKVAEQALRESEVHFKTLVENLPDVVARYDRDGRRLYSSPAAAAYLGLPERDLRGKTWREVGAPEEVASRWESAIRDVCETGQEGRFQFALATRMGQRHFDVRLVPEFTEAGKVESVLSISRDVSDQREALRALESQFDFQQKLIDAIPIPLFYRSRVGTYMGCNKAMEDALGIPRADIIGRVPDDLFLLPSPQAAGGFQGEGRPGEVQSYEGQFIRADGQRRDAVFTRAAFTDDLGHVAGYVGAIVDITERRQLEADRLNLQAREHRARMGEAMGLLVQGLAHEVRNPLFAIEANVAALGRRLEGTEDAAPFIAHIRHHVDRLGALMKDLMELGRRVDPEDFVHCDLVALLRQAAALVREADGAAADRIRIIPPQEPFTLLGEPRQLARAFFHVLSNAVEFSSEGQAVDVRVSADGDWATVTVTDLGVGIPERLKSTLFEPFVTGRTGHPGLGLTLARHYLAAHGADLQAGDNPSGRGTTVTTRIPRYAPAPAH